MPIQVLMPQLGESVDEATITRWLKARGDAVREMEPLVEINTDKVDTEIPSPASGVLLDILCAPGVTVRAGEVLALIGVADGVNDGALKSQSQPLSPGPAAQPPPAVTPAELTGLAPVVERKGEAGRGLGFISPVVAKIAGEHGVNLADVAGTGLGGRITKNDVLAFIQRLPLTLAAPLSQAAPEPAAAQTGEDELISLPTVRRAIGEQSQEDELLPLTAVRRAIAEHMLISRRTSPHVTTFMEVDLSRVVAHRQHNQADFARTGVRLTYTAYFVSTAVAALKAFPLVNASWSERGILVHKAIHIGMATSLGEEGLIVPVIKNAEALSLLGLAKAIQDLAERARAKKLQPDEVKGGTFTITNHGISGSLFATPIINQPQCAILGVGAIQKRPVVISDEKLGDVIAIRPMAYISLTFDHRILDGALADNCLGRLKQALENWP